ncbi:MAG: FtsX-like permease family protein [Mucilaginibacter sp.]|nr:FtsX-like permease family protein [Mucilaginibacter sp.]
MIKSYFKTAWRVLLKNKVFSAINILGLSLGMAACLLILQYVNFELSYDHFNNNASGIYRVVNDRYQNNKLIQHGTITYSAVSKAMKDDYPEVLNYTRVLPAGDQIITYNDKKIPKERSFAVDNSFLSMFSYPLLAGDRKTALKEPNTVIISETLARKIFDVHDSNFDPYVGKLIKVSQDTFPSKVIAVIKDVPENSFLQFDMLLSYQTIIHSYGYKQAEYDFTDSDFWHYIQLKPGTDYKIFDTKLAAFSQRHFQGNKISGSVEKFYLQPLLNAHLYSDTEYEIGRTGSATVVWGLLLIALFIIGIAWINYINLATARSIERAKEVGIRKVTGATKGQLIRQFLTESLLINVIALAIALLMVYLAQSVFNSLVQHQLSFSYLFKKGLGGYVISIGLIAVILTGIFISGFYPAFVLSAFKPILVLKGRYSSSKKGAILRKGLVIGQFAITVVLITGSFVVYKQIKYMNGQKLGVNIDQVLIVNGPVFVPRDTAFVTRANSFVAELDQIPGVKNAATSFWVPGNEMGRNFGVRSTDSDPNTHFTMRFDGVSRDYIKTYDMQLLAGRDFTYTDYNSSLDKLHTVILNQNAIKTLGFSSPQAAIGRTIGRNMANRTKKWDIIGVVADFHQKSLRYPIEPTILVPVLNIQNQISIKVDSKNTAATVAAIKIKYQDFFPGNIFDYSFLNEQFNAQYKNDELFGKAFSIFGGFAIFIACLGLLGLSLFATIQRTKEIGVRKVLGASISNIVLLLSKDFIKLVVVAIIIATPVAWYILHNWLQDFAYRITISWWIFGLSGIVAIAVALATISFQAVRAASSNPVKSLRSE